MKTQLVVARYNEDVSWLESVDLPSVIYNKGRSDLLFARSDIWIRQLYNVGREAHTYLWHILNNWNNLADTTIFTQGDPFTHSPDFLGRLLHDYEDTTSLTIRHLPHHPCKWITDQDFVEYKHGFEIRYGKICHFNEMGYYFNARWFDLLWSRLFVPECKPKDPIFGYGAIYAVPKDRILARPRSFYQYCFKQTEQYPILLNAFAFEALWHYIWSDRNLYPEINPTLQPPHSPDPIEFTDPVNFKRRYFTKNFL